MAMNPLAVPLPPAPSSAPVGAVARRPVVPAPVVKRAPGKAGLLLGLLGAVVVLGGGTLSFLFMRPESAEPVAPIRPAAVPAAVPAVPVTAPVPETPKPPPAPTPARLEIAPLPSSPEMVQAAATDQAKSAKAAVNAAPVVSPEFRLWTDGVRISGVASGSSPRAIINGRLVRPGDLIDTGEGIVFEGIDVEKKQVMFRNRAGAVAGKAY